MAPWKDRLDAPEDVKARIPSGYDMVGDVVVVRVPEELRAFEAAVGEAVLATQKAARVVAVDRGVEGPFRARRLDVVAGDKRTTTEIVEHGLRLRMDLATCYFSPRLSGERGRVAAMVRPGEKALDLFAGVGPFALLCAKRGANVVAVDANPDAILFLSENARLNKVADRVEPRLGDAREVAATLPGWAERVIMNLPHEAPRFLDAAVAATAPGGTIHLGAMVNRFEVEAFKKRLPDRIAGRGIAVVHAQHVRNYNPAVRHYVFDLQVA